MNDLVIILGCKLKNCLPTNELLLRVDAAEKLLHNLLNKPVIIASGGITSNDCKISEGSIIKELLIKDKIVDNIILENTSKSTIGNAFYSYMLINNLNLKVKKMYLISSCYHKERATKIFDKFFSNINIISDFCANYYRNDETEKEKTIRDMDILKNISMNDITKTELYLKPYI